MRPVLLRATPRGVWLLRGIVGGGVVLALLAGVPEGYRPPVLLVLVVLAGAVFSAFRPEHLSLPITMGLTLAWWALELGGEMPVAVLVAAAGLTASHVAAVLLGYGPPALPVEPRLAVLWASRALLAWVASLVVWGVARTYSGHGTPALFWLSGLAATLVGAVLVGAAAPVRTSRAGR